MRVVCLGAHILDVLGRPVVDIPAGQGRRVLDEIRITAAGTAGGTKVDLAKLGADVVSVGPVGADASGRMLRALLEDHGVDTSGLVVKPAATPTTMLPIRPDGSRPALHAPGAMPLLAAGDLDPDLVAGADVLHVGGPDVLGDFAVDVLPDLLRHARAHGTVVSVDLLSTARPALLDRLGALWPLVDHLLPNDDQLRSLTGRTDPGSDLGEAAAVLRERGVGTVVVTRGGDGCLVVSAAGAEALPARPVPVVDTTGCGDAFTAGYLVGLGRGGTLADAARLGTAAASLVAQGLGSDAGIVDLPSTLRLLGADASVA
ncbi:carbohydrate kinase family protein [Pseudonocardia oroxyli]|uniref:Sugar or nucleoside kinase, ribokinase family n=1 Tax=Pseudonocardia oroxyli TaxID=366584 RepID=A0A1G7W9P9_PSEOR|nr:sugar kinase [Pseudonocardia oroxyli]SDG67800.1 Sugar or nucleoside kinase, ribokinase family [Pseudonocardia oroxyli]